EGRLKILDFGLAKQVTSLGPGSHSFLPTEAMSLGPNTEKGMILGTLGYMSPEQVRGEAVDARADIFSFGVVLFEMLTGRRAFGRDTAADTMAAILKEDPPDLSTASRPLPPGLRRILDHCLEKVPARRFRDVQDLAFALENVATASESEATLLAPFAPEHRRTTWTWALLGAVILLVVGGLGTWWGTRLAPASNPGEVRFPIGTEDAQDMGLDWSDASFALSPDGTQIAYITRSPTGGPAIFVRAAASLTPRNLLAGATGGLTYDKPFWSPDGQSIAYHLGDRLMRVSAAGGDPQTICTLPGLAFGGGTWCPDGTILYGAEPYNRGSQRIPGLYRVPASGGDPQPLTWLTPGKEIGHRWPVLLPDGRHFLYQSRPTDILTDRSGGIWLGSLDGKPPVRLVGSAYKAAWVAPDWLIYVRGTSLVAQHLSLAPPEVHGDAVVITETLALESIPGHAAFAATPSGHLLYRAGAEPAFTQLAWFDRKGNRNGLVGEASQDVSVALSPDGTRAAVATVSGRNDRGRVEPPVNLWLIDLARNARTRFTFNPANSDENPVWSPDGRRLAFATHFGAEKAKLSLKEASGTGEAQPLPMEDLNPHPLHWSPDGATLLLQQVGGIAQRELGTLPIPGGGKSEVFETGAPVAQGQFSPDGRFVAFASSESGRSEVFVRPYPKGEGKWQVSLQGGSVPRWRKDGKELYFMDNEGTLYAVPVRLTPTFEAGRPTALFKSGLRPTPPDYYGGAANYDVAGDGNRFLLLTVPRRGSPPPINVILHWKPPGGARP
ncbi:MAG TPA: protein kinase, partial [Holophagaceae bacterium]|nr:protein kinase [Holophagaceae bacterium]